MNIIKAVNLVFDYIRRDEEGQVEEVKRALDHVNLEIEKGSFVAILGHNGSGKSTFAKQINGILSPTDGTLFVSEMIRGTRRICGISAKMRAWSFRTRITRS